MKHTVKQKTPFIEGYISPIYRYTPAYLTDGPDEGITSPTDCAPARVYFAAPATLSPLQTRSSTAATASPPVLWASARTAGGAMGLGCSRRTAERREREVGVSAWIHMRI